MGAFESDEENKHSVGLWCLESSKAGQCEGSKDYLFLFCSGFPLAGFQRMLVFIVLSEKSTKALQKKKKITGLVGHNQELLWTLMQRFPSVLGQAKNLSRLEHNPEILSFDVG